MLKITMELLKELAQLIILAWIIGLGIKVFFKHTLLGKITAVIFKDIYMFIRVSLRISKRTGKVCYKVSKKLYKYLDSKFKEHEEVVEEKQVVNGYDNVFDLNTYRKMKNKKGM